MFSSTFLIVIIIMNFIHLIYDFFYIYIHFIIVTTFPIFVFLKDHNLEFNTNVKIGEVGVNFMLQEARLER